MNREILFRGKCIEEAWIADVGDWVYGGYMPPASKYFNKYLIGNVADCAEVDPETVGHIAVVCGEIEAEKEKLIEKISAENDMNFINIINPETYCHPKKQILSAENWARHISVKHCNVILTTNSFHYLEAFLFYLEKYNVNGNIRFYLVKDGFYTTVTENL
ncbi:MAG: hypothetical protein NC548_43585 [Lachnospiraceae bacterium]|nr:hypothetical protein [Lachnospiraceae bacterium]